jgi:hypothetical protein
MLTGIETAGKEHSALYSSLFVSIRAARIAIKGTIELAHSFPALLDSCCFKRS